MNNMNLLARFFAISCLAYFSACTFNYSTERKQTIGKMQHENLCPDNQPWKFINVDTNQTSTMRLMEVIKGLPKVNFTLFTLKKQQFIDYKGMYFSEKRYAADTTEICFLQRTDIAEVDDFPHIQASLCFNSMEDSLLTLSNDSQLLVKLSHSKFITLHPNMIEVDIISVAQTGTYLLIGTYVPASSGTAANYLHVYIFETNHDHVITLYRDLNWKTQEIQWLK